MAGSVRREHIEQVATAPSDGGLASSRSGLGLILDGLKRMQPSSVRDAGRRRAVRPLLQ